MHDIVITEFMDEAAVDTLRRDFSVHYDPGLADRQPEIVPLLAGVRALVVRNRTQVSAAMLGAAPKLQCVGRLGVGLDNIDVETCAARRIEVYPATGANDIAVAEYVLASTLNLLRGAYAASGQVSAGAWPRQALIGGEIFGKTLGLIGYGAIARQTAARARAFGMKTVAFDPFLAAADPVWGETEPVSLDVLLAKSDVVSLHVPLTASTRHMLAAPQFAAMKRGAIVINAARGGVLCESALTDALRSGHLGGAALDVFEVEPLNAENGARFAGLSNVILTPHVAGVTFESNARVSALIAVRVAERLRRR